MLTIPKRLLALITPGDRKTLTSLLAMLVLSAVIDTLGVASIMPFMAVVARPDVLLGSGLLAEAYRASGFQSTTSFLIAAGALSLIALVVSNIVSALSNWMLFRFTYQQSHALAVRLLVHYMTRPYAFFLQRNTSELLKNLFTESLRVNTGVMLPFLQVLARTSVTVLLVSVLVAADPLLAISVALVISVSYASVYISARRRLNRLGRQTTAAHETSYRVANEALSGIKDIRIAGRESEFLRRFSEPSSQIASNQTIAQANILFPRHLLETIAFGGILLIALYLVLTRHDPASVIPAISLYAFAGYRLMPALQQIYTGITTIRFNRSALDTISADLVGESSVEALYRPQDSLPIVRDIVFEKLDYAYPGTEPVLHDFSLRIAANTTVAITGPSGAGKTTLIDVMLGLLQPTAGKLLVDGTMVDTTNVRRWQCNLGYVPQQIFLTDDTITANIALGVPKHQIDQDAIRRAARLAQLDEFVATLAGGYDTVIGERGVRLSGGQRQRIGIARALYSDPPVLVLDEATSALDNITEGVIMEAIRQLAHKKTIIIIAHRLSTVRECDVIHLMESGAIVASGTYDGLVAESPAFRALIAAAGKPE